MGASRYIGRPGGLAVALRLGVGTAVATGQGWRGLIPPIPAERRVPHRRRTGRRPNPLWRVHNAGAHYRVVTK
jgi:hypothetical protein